MIPPTSEYEKSIKLFKQYAYRRMEVDSKIRDRFVNEVLKIAKYGEYTKGDLIVEQDQINENLFIMLSGTCDIIINDKTYVSLKRRGDIIGEMSVIRHIPCSATVKAGNDVTMLIIPRDAVINNIDIVSFISAGLSQKLEWATYNAQENNESEKSILEKDTYIAKQVLDSELKKIKELQKAYNAVKKAEETKDEILRNITHELRTPLNGILGFSQLILIQDHLELETIKEYTRMIKDNGDSLLALVGNLIEISKLYSGSKEFIFGQYNIVQEVGISIDAYQSIIREKALEVTFTPEEEDIQCLYDRKQIQNVLKQLLKNAVQFSKEGSKIEIQVINRSKNCIVSIRDSGCGVPSDEFDTIFESFSQSSRTNDGSGGRGLGLAIAKSIIVAHEEDIWVENNENKAGACFKFSLSKI